MIVRIGSQLWFLPENDEQDGVNMANITWFDGFTCGSGKEQIVFRLVGGGMLTYDGDAKELREAMIALAGE